MTSNDDAARRRSHFEVVATVLLAIAAVATAWSGYQAARWNGEATKASSQVNALRIDAARSQGLAEGQTQVDIATFFEWVDADIAGDAELAQFYDDRFRAEFRPAFDAWLAMAPARDPTEAPGTPFALAEYRLAAAEAATDLDAEAEATAAIVRRNLQRSANYVLAAVLFSVALFFAGISTKMSGAALEQRSSPAGTSCFSARRSGSQRRPSSSRFESAGPGYVTDILIRDVPDEVLVAIDAKAKLLGLSRTVYLRRALELNGSSLRVR